MTVTDILDAIAEIGLTPAQLVNRAKVKIARTTKRLRALVEALVESGRLAKPYKPTKRTWPAFAAECGLTRNEKRAVERLARQADNSPLGWVAEMEDWGWGPMPDRSWTPQTRAVQADERAWKPRRAMTDDLEHDGGQS
jgi:hypothetical protein